MCPDMGSAVAWTWQKQTINPAMWSVGAVMLFEAEPCSLSEKCHSGEEGVREEGGSVEGVWFY